MSLNTGECSVKDFALAIIDGEESRPSGVPRHYFGEICMNIGGQIVNAEMVVTFANGRPCGKQYVPDLTMPGWKRFIKKLLNI